LVLGTSGVVAKILALPVFCMAIIVTRLVSFRLPPSWAAFETALMVKCLLLLAAAVMAIAWGPFSDGDSVRAVIMGMTLVAAMAIQNAAHRIHLSSAPPSTLMTGTTTQMMIDVADMIRGISGPARDAIKTRLRHMGAAVAGFVIGAATGAWLFHSLSVWCFVLPPLIALLSRITANSSPSAPGSTPVPRTATT
jgi:uncharacterized membrane protein YoaK (UPF0700 family)